MAYTNFVSDIIDKEKKAKATIISHPDIPFDIHYPNSNRFTTDNAIWYKKR